MSSHFRGDKLGEGGQIGERVTNSVGGQTWVLDKQGVGTNGGESVSKASMCPAGGGEFVGEARKRPAGARIWARRALKF